MLAYRIKTILSEDHRVTLPDSVPAGEVELLVLVEDVPEVNDPEDLEAYRKAKQEFAESGEQTFTIEEVAAELGITIPNVK